MKFKIHFRGVGVFVAKNKGNVTEVLFPRAESKAPPDGDPGELKPDKTPLGKGMKHADNTDAPPHFAGALVVRRKANLLIPLFYRKLNGRLVTRGVQNQTGAKPTATFFEELPALADFITRPKSQLKVLAAGDPSNFDRIATRFVLDSGDIEATDPSTGLWLLAGGIHGMNAITRRFSRGVTWKVDASEPLELALLDLDGKPSGEDSIKLDSEEIEVFFYSYDLGLPTFEELNKEELPPVVNLVDNDFKWCYALLDRVGGQPSWRDWLNNNPFPAPQLIALDTEDGRLVPVSTCYPMVWTGL